MLIRDYYSVTYTITYKDSSQEHFESTSCFSNLFHLDNESRKNISCVDVLLFKQNNRNNIVIVSKEQIQLFLNYLKHIVRFKYILEEKDKYYNLQIKFKDFTNLQVRFLFTCIRKLFEYPYSATLYDWFLLCDKKWKNLSKLTTLYFLDFCCFDHIHGLCSHTSRVKKISLKELKKYLDSNGEYLSGMFEYLPVDKIRDLEFLRFTYDSPVFSEKITTEKAYKERKKLYENIFKKLKNEGICSR